MDETLARANEAAKAILKGVLGDQPRNPYIDCDKCGEPIYLCVRHPSATGEEASVRGACPTNDCHMFDMPVTT